MNDFYKSLDCCKIKPVALSLVNPYAVDFILKIRDIPTVSDLFDKKYLTVEYHELLIACTDISININERDIKLIEKDTRKQSKGASFYHHRAGGLVHPSASLPVTQILFCPHNPLLRQYVTPTFSNLVQLPWSTDASMKTKPLRLLRTL